MNWGGYQFWASHRASSYLATALCKNNNFSPEADFSQIGGLADAVNATEGDDERFSRLSRRNDVTKNVDTTFWRQQSQQWLGQNVFHGAMNALQME